MVLAILAVLAGSALADGNPPATTDSVPTITQPVITNEDPTPPAVTVPSMTAPVSLPVTGDQVQALLLKQVRAKLVQFTSTANHWQSMLGHKPLRPINIWALGGLQRANHLLAERRHQSYRLYLEARRLMRQRILAYRRTVQLWRLVAGIHPAVRTLAQARSGLEEEFAWWHQAAESVQQQASHPPHYTQFMCIHGYEGAWNDNTGNSYYRGLQMNLGFQASYGGWLLRTKGTANNWTPLEQIWVAERALRSRGYGPWPQTAHYCGLL